MTRSILTRLGGAIALHLALAGTLHAESPERIVIAGGDLTEIAVALGAADRIVGVDSTSTWPPSVAGLAQIGYVRRLSPEGILSLSPDLLIAAADAGPQPVLHTLKTTGLAVASAPESDGIEGIRGKILFVGKALGTPGSAKALLETFDADIALIRGLVASVATDETNRPRVLFILSTQGGAPLVGGAGTAADTVIAEAGGINAAAEISGYKPMNAEAIIASAPDFILMTSAHADRLGGLDDVLSRPDIALTPAGKAGRGVSMDALLLLGMGPRTPQAILELAGYLYGEVSGN